MTTRQISFSIQGMFCAKCPASIERALAQLDGVVAAHVNYATERASLIYDPARVTLGAMVQTVRGEGFGVPLERVTLNVDGLLYATSAQLVEHTLSRIDGVVGVEANLGMEHIVVDAFAESVNHPKYTRALATLGLSVVERIGPRAARGFVLRTVALVGLGFLSLLSAGAHAGWWVVSGLHAPILVIAISVLAAYGIGWRFYRMAYDACLHGETDASVIVALVATVLLFGGLPLALISPAPWVMGIGFVLITLSTTGWFVTRALALWVIPRLQSSSTVKKSVLTLPQTQLGIISHGTRR